MESNGQQDSGPQPANSGSNPDGVTTQGKQLLYQKFFKHPTRELTRGEKTAYSILWKRIQGQGYVGKYKMAYYQGHNPTYMGAKDEYDTHPDEDAKWDWKAPGEREIEREKKKPKVHGDNPWKAAMLIVAIKANRKGIVDNDVENTLLRSFFTDPRTEYIISRKSS